MKRSPSEWEGAEEGEIHEPGTGNEDDVRLFT